MACDPNTLLEQSKCITTCIPRGMMPAVGLAALCRISVGAASLPALDNLVAYWKMDEAGSVPRIDSSGNGHTLSVTGTVNSAAGIINNGAAFAFNPANFLSNADPVWSGATPFTVFCWVKFNGNLASTQPLVAHFNSGGLGNGWELIQNSSSRLAIRTADGSGANTDVVHTTVITVGSFFLFIASIDTPVHAIVRVNNGADIGGVIVTPSNPAIDLRIGTNQVAGQPFDGTIDEVGVYNRVLTSAEKDALWNGGAGKSCCPFT